jgi:hypothetical protein
VQLLTALNFGAVMAWKFGNSRYLHNGTREQATNFLEQAVWKAALGDVTVGAVAATFFFERGALDFGIDDDAQGWVRAAKLVGGLQAVEARHSEIEEHEIGLMLGDELDGIDAVASGADNFQTARKIQVVADGTESRRGIIGDQDADWIDARHC